MTARTSLTTAWRVVVRFQSRRPGQRLAGPTPASQFLRQRLDHLAGAIRFQFLRHPAEGDPNHVAVMQVGAKPLTEVQPELVGQFHVLRPKPGWMRAKIVEL